MTLRSCARVLAVAFVAAAVPSPATADPGRWMLANDTGVPLEYFQGIAFDPELNLFFDGIFTGLYKGRAAQVGDEWAVVETARSNDVIPEEVRSGEGYNHIGDIDWAPDPVRPAGDGRVLLPLECFDLASRRNACVQTRDGVETVVEPGTGAVGVAVENKLRLVKSGDKLVRSFDWEYYVKLDRHFLSKAMWIALSPDGRHVWTQGTSREWPFAANDDLLAFATADISRANAADPARTDNRELTPVARLEGVVPGSLEQISGAAFLGGRLYVAGQHDDDDGELPMQDTFEVWSLDVTRCSVVTRCDPRREIQFRANGESEGLAFGCTLGGLLHWQIAPNNSEFLPTYWLDPEGTLRTTILSYRPVATDLPACDAE